MPKTVEVEGLGTFEFPDDATQKEINRIIRRAEERRKAGDPDFQTRVVGQTDPKELFNVAQRGVGRGLKIARMADLLEQENLQADEIAQIQKDFQDLRPSDEYIEMDRADTFTGAAKALAKDPVKVTAELMAESTAALVSAGITRIPQFVATGAAAGAGVGAAAGGVGAIPGALTGAQAGLAGGVAKTTMALESANRTIDLIREEGHDPTNAEDLQEVFSNEELWQQIRTKAQLQSIPMTAFDALSAGFAGRFGGPIARALGGGRGVALAAETGVQAASGVAGEATGQAVRGEFRPGGILAEGIAEVPFGLAEISVGTAFRRAANTQDSALTAEGVVEEAEKQAQQQERPRPDLQPEVTRDQQEAQRRAEEPTQPAEPQEQPQEAEPEPEEPPRPPGELTSPERPAYTFRVEGDPENIQIRGLDEEFGPPIEEEVDPETVRRTLERFRDTVLPRLDLGSLQTMQIVPNPVRQIEELIQEPGSQGAKEVAAMAQDIQREVESRFGQLDPRTPEGLERVQEDLATRVTPQVSEPEQALGREAELSEFLTSLGASFADVARFFEDQVVDNLSPRGMSEVLRKVFGDRASPGEGISQLRTRLNQELRSLAQKAQRDLSLTRQQERPEFGERIKGQVLSLADIIDQARRSQQEPVTPERPAVAAAEPEREQFKARRPEESEPLGLNQQQIRRQKRLRDLLRRSSLGEIQSEARARGLSTEGTSQEVIDRILGNQREEMIQQSAGQEAFSRSRLQTMPKNDLRQVARGLGLSLSSKATKNDLIRRILEHQQGQESIGPQTPPSEEEIRAQQARAAQQIQDSQAIPPGEKQVIREMAPDADPAEGPPDVTQEAQNRIEDFVPQAKRSSPFADPTQFLSDLGDYEANKRVANQPHGLSKIPGLGWMFDPRGRQEAGLDAVLTRQYEVQVGRAIAQAVGQALQGAGRPFQIEEGGSRILNVTANPEMRITNEARRNSLHISDVFENLQEDPQAYELTPEQRIGFERMLTVINRVREMRRDHGLIQRPDDGGDLASADAAYFTRVVTGKEGENAFNTGFLGWLRSFLPAKLGGTQRAVGVKPGAQRPRQFESEREGAEAGFLYEPSIEARLVKLVEENYRQIADRRFISDPVLQAQVRRPRFQRESFGPAGNPAFQVFRPIRAEGQKDQVVPIPLVFPKEVANTLNRYFKDQSNEFLNSVRTANSAVKTFMFGLDFAAPFLQGQVMMFSNPARWARATLTSAKAFLDPRGLNKYLQNPERQTAMKELADNGVSLGVLPEFMSAARPGGVLERLPGVGKVFGAAGRAFQVFTDAALIELWLAHRASIPQSELPQVAETLQNMLARGRMEEIGVTPTRALTERLLLTAASFQRGAAGFLSTAFTRRNGLSGRIARQALGKWLGGLTLAYLGHAYLARELGMTEMDEDELENRMNPENGQFLMLPLQFSESVIEVGMGGPFRSLVRLGGEVTSTAITEPGDLSPADTSQNPIWRFLRGKLAPVPSVSWDLIAGRDFLGNKVDVWNILQNRAPVIAQEAISPRPGGQPLTPEEFMLAFLGLQVYPQNVRDKFRIARRERARERFGKQYEELGIMQQAEITKELQESERFQRNQKQFSPQQIVAAKEFDQQRLNKLRSKLSSELKKRLKDNDVELRGFEPTFTIGGTKLFLTEQQQRFYAERIATHYEELLGRVTSRERFSRLEPSDRQEKADAMMRDAKERSRIEVVRRFSN